MSTVRCFLLTPTGRYRVLLRRFVLATASKCPNGYHNASVPFGAEVTTSTPGEVPHDDPAWPKQCGCGYAFTDADQWQVNHHEIHARSDGGPECTIRDAPTGAMWFADWFLDRDPPPTPGTLWCGPDGHCLVVKLPDGAEWLVDGPANNAPADRPGWTRTGAVPQVTARPSILTSHYHGWLTDGVLTSC